jgi:phosphonate degradation associated HDIG domain protein
MDLLSLYAQKGDRLYGERVSQTAHALQCAALAEAEGASPALVVAALLHDVGHLLTKRAEDVDDRHQDIAAGVLTKLYGAAVAEPVRLHVAAKRWLCAMEPGYFETLSTASVKSLELQGGPFTRDAADAFLQNPYARDAIRLRRWDDLAKVPEAPTKTLAAYAPLVAAMSAGPDVVSSTGSAGRGP